MIKSKGILTISIISLFAVESAYAAIASSRYVDQQVETRISEVVEAGDGNVVSSISTERTKVTATKGINAEITDNKVNEIRTDGTAEDTKYPSEKAVATALDAKQDKLEGEVLTNTATGTDSFSTGNASPASAGTAVAIGENATVQNSGTAIGYLTSSGGSGVALGARASSNKMGGVSIGAQSAVEGDRGIAVGTGAQSAGESSISIGMGAGALSDYAIQLGKGTNSEANTLSVGLSDSNNYKLLGSDGKIPAERLPNGILTNTATGTDSFSTGAATPTFSNFSVAIGSGASNGGTNSVAIGYTANSGSSGEVAIGNAAATSGYESTAVGYDAAANNGNATAVGSRSEAAATGSTALGYSAKTQQGAHYAIQLGAGTNSEANTLSVGLSTSNNYKLLGSDGKIPAERLPFEGDVLTNTATGSASFSTGGANAATSNNSIAIGPGTTSVEESVAIGSGASNKQSNSVAIGYTANSGHSGEVAIGNAASTSGYDSTAIGYNSVTKGNATAVGSRSEAAATSSTALGYSAKTQQGATFAIQLGTGTNSEANTFSVGLDGTNNYKLLGSDGKIPAERLPVARIPVGSETSTSYASIWVE